MMSAIIGVFAITTPACVSVFATGDRAMVVVASEDSETAATDEMISTPSGKYFHES